MDVPAVFNTGLPGPEIATLQSPPFSVIASQTLKPSQNLYTELILRTLGKVTPPPATTSNLGQTSEELGLEAVKTFLKTVGIRPEALNLDDGSGLSRNDMITAEASVQLLTFMSKHRYANVFRDALPIGGVDGTLRNRFRGTLAGEQCAREDRFVEFGLESRWLRHDSSGREARIFDHGQQLSARC
jgi:D-alanyl-D-alanine carboxypeptidase/D-alanyl-D-alanine-endopeptidase (penicillin-binding protein 4)